MKVPKLKSWIQQRQCIAQRYRAVLENLPGLTLPNDVPGHSWNQFVVRISCDRDGLKQRLQEFGVNTIIYYPIPIHRQPAYDHLGLGMDSLPFTEQLCQEVLSLPIFPELTELQQRHVVIALEKILSEGNIHVKDETNANSLAA